MIAALSQLHEHVHHAEEVPTLQYTARVAGCHEVLVVLPLPLGQPTVDGVLVLGWQLCSDGRLESTQYERSQYGVQSSDELSVELLTALYHGLDRHTEPLSELSLTLEHGRHEEVHERPQLHHTVLQRSAGEQQSALRVEGQQRLQRWLLKLRMFCASSSMRYTHRLRLKMSASCSII